VGVVSKSHRMEHIRIHRILLGNRHTYQMRHHQRYLRRISGIVRLFLLFFKQIKIITWIKTNPIPVKNSYSANRAEYALICTKILKGYKRTFNTKNHNGFFYYPVVSSNNKVHPTMKNKKLFEELIKIHSNENDLILDCFMGSGVTARCCKILNRNFIGSELDLNYFNKIVI